MNRNDALQWCVENLKEWPSVNNLHECGMTAPCGWGWMCRADGVRVLATTVYPPIHELDWLHTLGILAKPAPDTSEPTPLSRNEALQWCVKNLKEWPDHKDVGLIVSPDGWTWLLHGVTTILSHAVHHPIGRDNWVEAVKQVNNDAVKQPKHYEVLDGIEAIEIIAASLTRDEWRGYCVGNVMKYRLRAGKKDDLQQDIAKADEYQTLFEKYKELNRATN